MDDRNATVSGEEVTGTSTKREYLSKQ